MASPAVSVSRGFSWSKNMNPSDLSRFEFNLTVYKHFSQGYPVSQNWPKWGTPEKSAYNGQIELGATQIARIHVFRPRKPLSHRNYGITHRLWGVSDFRFSKPIPTLYQGQVSIFRVQECAQSIPRIEKPPGVIILTI